MKYILLSFLTPPGLFLLVLGALWWVWRPARRRLYVFIALTVALLWVPNTMAFGRFLSLGLLSAVSGRTLSTPQQADAIVVLTGGMYKAGNIGWIPTTQSYRRLAVAYELQRMAGSRVPILLSGGKTTGVQHPSEAAVTAGYFDKFQAQYTPLLLEETSTDTYESSLQVAGILEKRSATDVFLVTDEVHMLRALAAYRARGIDAVPFPAITLSLGRLRFVDYLPSAKGAMRTTAALYEIYGLATYLLSGKIKFSDIFYKP